MKLIQELRLPYQKDPDLKTFLSKHLGLSAQKIQNIRVKKRSLDARNPKKLIWVYSLEIYFEGEKIEEQSVSFPQLKWKGPPPLILGAGPAGLFAAHTFLAHGIKPILFERGERTHERMLKISNYWRRGILDEDSNVCNGEGGAGTFSDGKLITRIKSPLIQQVMQTFVTYGAPPEITYVYNPHVGSNLIREVIRKMSDDLIARGVDLRFSTRVEALDLYNNQVQGVHIAPSPQPFDRLRAGSSPGGGEGKNLPKKIMGTGLILACGHSAGNFFKILHQQGLHFEAKDFALGLRIEHPQTYINKWQYGKACPLPDLETAQYKLQTFWEKEQIGVYSFCMCPGGYVISSSTNPETIVVNGMSNYHRNSPWANAAIVCSVSKNLIKGDDPFKLMHFQREIEKKVYAASAQKGETRRIPAQRLEDFLAGKEGKIEMKSSCPSGIVASDLSKLLPPSIYKYLQKGFLEFDSKRKGFAHPDALLHAVESRTSSPVRMTRNPETYESISIEGLFPSGEGPGYAGGITSAAVDGMKAALAWIKKFT